MCGGVFFAQRENQLAAALHPELAEDFLGGENSAVDIRVRVIRDGKDGDIINQYVRFTRVLAAQVTQYGRTRKAITETIRICKDQNVLKKYFQNREEEVVSIMIALYDYETSLNKKIKLERLAAKNEGKEEQAQDAAIELHKNNVPIEVIAASLHRSVDTIRQWPGLLSA